MTYLSLDKIREARTYVEQNIKKPDTFMGLVLFLICVVERKRNGSYLKSDMKRFSEFADDAFYLSDAQSSYSDKYWFALLTNDWVDQVKDYFLKGNKVSANKVMQSLFWLDSFAELKSKASLIPNDIFESLFIEDLDESDFNQASHVTKADLLLSYDGTPESLTIKFDGSFVKKKAGDLSGAPFGQTLYAATEIKKIISIYDFDFIDKFDLSSTVGSPKVKVDLVIKSIREKFKSWMLSKGLSEKTVSSYSGSGIAYCDRFISNITGNVLSFYQLDSQQVLKALRELEQVAEWLQADKSGNSMYSAACKKLAEFLAEEHSNSYTSLPKPFLLLAGISGTGKTRFVREQAKTSGQFDETYCLVSVRPDWHEPSDLLGYVSRLGQQPQYIATDVLRFIVRAWKAIIKSIDFDANDKAIDWTGRDLQDIPPYWLCLDEMNLAPVEQYFADYLSILETRCWNDPDVSANSNRDYVYQCDPLLSADIFKDLDSNSGEDHNSEKINAKPSTLLAKDLGLDLTTPLEKDIWAYFLEHGISIPFNLIVAGTVNMDETTHGFSRKVIDRALSFDFGAFFPNKFDEFADFGTPKSCNKRLSYPIWSNACKADLVNTFDVDGAKTVAFLSAVNEVLQNTPFELAFRALNELLLAVASCQPQDDLTLKAVWDDFMMCKVLPRIEGDTDKLTTSDGKALLVELDTVLANQLAPIWLASETDEANQRPDLYREKIVADGATDEEKVLRIPCRSKAKLKWMSERLASATFTSFWP
ncbi:McrB family protein [Aliiglaciecola sp. SL4]|uniref:McrB family protein n=1 Tax=Aliiglaciecola sp. SL4 TaxID=3239806 RepID=UPI00355B7479